ncbi:MAG: sulfotransferase [Litorimonas sp.]
MNDVQTYQKLMSKGKAFLKNDDYSAAKLSLEAALGLVPDSYEGWLDLSTSLYHLKSFSDAIKACERAEKFDPLKKEFQQIQQAMHSRQFATAQSIARDMLKKHPGHPRAVFTLSHLLQMRNAFEDQVAILKLGLEHSPANVHLRKTLIAAYQDMGDVEEAIKSATDLFDLESGFSNAWSRIGLFIRYGFNESALNACQAARPLCGDNKALISELDLLQGHALKTLGRREEAIASYRACIVNKPKSGAPWWALADLKTYEFSSSEIQSLESLIQSKSLSPEHQCQALFALAKAHEMKSGLTEAMPHYERANAAYPYFRFDAVRFRNGAKLLVNSFNKSAVFKQAKPIPNGPRPIFIVGLPRSGSTLLEQILASHSRIEGTMELPVLPNIKRKMHLTALNKFSKSFLQNLDLFSEKDLSHFGQDYLNESAVFRSENAPFFIDKLPHNFEHIGLIHKILPNAVILDIRRHPMDCGLSLFKQFFARGVEFSYKLQDIGAYYSSYQNIMSHWDEVLPNRVLHIQYEELVQNLEPQLRIILKHIGVDFETACLEFYKSKRAVRTASSEQVRMPIFTSAIGVWKEVEENLSPLKTALNHGVN